MVEQRVPGPELDVVALQSHKSRKAMKEGNGGTAVIELKVRRGADVLQQGLVQLGGYLDRLGRAEGHLVLFDRRPRVSWAERIYIEEHAGLGGQRIYVYGA